MRFAKPTLELDIVASLGACGSGGSTCSELRSFGTSFRPLS